MIRAIGFVAGGAVVFAGLLVLMSPPRTPAPGGQVELPIRQDTATPAPARHDGDATAPGPVRDPQERPARPRPGDTERVHESVLSAGASAPDEAALVDAMFAQRESTRASAEPAREAGSALPAATPTAAPAQEFGGGPPGASAAASAPAMGDEAIPERAVSDAAIKAATSEAAPPAARQSAPPAAPTWPADVQWFAVWDPFHSELSANAFARRLERLTGLDYRVVRSAPAQYEVAVAFRSEQERLEHVAAIEEATGLRIAGGSL